MRHKGSFTKLAALLFLVILGTSNASAYTIDNKLAEAMVNSGDASELAWMKTVTSDNSLVLDFKIDNNDSGFNFYSNGPDSWYIDVAPNTPGYFMLKFGTGGTDATADHFAFQNVSDLSKLVWSNDQVQYLSGGDCANNDNSCNIGRLSHFVGLDGNKVPEPGTLALLGLGLLGMTQIRSRK